MAQIPLGLKRGSKHLRLVAVDDCDADLSAFKWRLCREYARRHTDDGVGEFMHRVILSRKLGRMLVDGEFTDHINGNGLDNRRSNLRSVTTSQNGQNRKMNRNSTSGHVGVTWHKKDQRWQASVKLKGRHIHLGQFRDILEAAKIAKEKRIELGFLAQATP